MEVVLLFSAATIIFSLLFFVIFSYIAKQRHLRNRVEYFISSNKDETIREPKKKKSKRNVIKVFSRVFQNIRFSEKTKMLLLQSGSTVQPEEFFIYRIVASVALFLLFLLFQLNWLFSFIAIFVGFLLPKFYMVRKRNKRLQRLPIQLIEALGIMSNAMRAGFSFMQAMQLVGKEMPGPLGPEFDRVVREVGLGVTLEQSFEEMLERLPSKELEVVTQAVVTQRKSGGNLAQLLETMEDTIRGRVRILGELKTLTAQGKMSSWVITLLPVGLGFYLNAVDPEYFSPMLHHPLGIGMLVLASTLTLIGWLIIQKIVKIEV